jgi:four helix bundle protein
MSQAAADELQRRLVSFAVQIIELVGHFPKTPAGRHVSGQILRSGTSPAPNYGEARGAESRADFVHKLRIAVKELNETGIWLLIILEARMVPTFLVENLIKENRELACIFGASIRTAQARASRSNKQQITIHE